MAKRMWWQRQNRAGYKIVERKSGKFVVLSRGRKVSAFCDRELAEVFVRGAMGERERLNEIGRTAKTFEEYLWRAYEQPTRLKDIEAARLALAIEEASDAPGGAAKIEAASEVLRKLRRAYDDKASAFANPQA